jgi:hypothetical protein
MPSHPLVRIGICSLLGLVAGFIALAIAVPMEPSIPVALLTLFSPGLKIAELIMPQEHGSLGWTFGWFLRIAIGVNAVLYFGIFTALAYFLGRKSKQV